MHVFRRVEVRREFTTPLARYTSMNKLLLLRDATYAAERDASVGRTRLYWISQLGGFTDTCAAGMYCVAGLRARSHSRYAKLKFDKQQRHPSPLDYSLQLTSSAPSKPGSDRAGHLSMIWRGQRRACHYSARPAFGWNLDFGPFASPMTYLNRPLIVRRLSSPNTCQLRFRLSLSAAVNIPLSANAIMHAARKPAINAQGLLTTVVPYQ